MGAHRLWFAGLVVCAVACGCSQTPSDSTASRTTTPSPTAQSESPATRAGPLGAPTAHGLVEALEHSGLEMQNPVDTTKQECRAIGCRQSVVTDRLRIRSFDETGQAQKYAAEAGASQVETVVVTFAPVVPDAERERYWAEIVRLVTAG
jgi:hypothetical protein